jgi:hypothetical protein
MMARIGGIAAPQVIKPKNLICRPWYLNVTLDLVFFKGRLFKIYGMTDQTEIVLLLKVRRYYFQEWTHKRVPLRISKSRNLALNFFVCLGRVVPTRSDRRLRSLHRSRRQRFDRRSALLHASRDARVSPAGEHRRRRTSQQQQENILQLLVHQEVGGRDGEVPSK